jgi:hypothetical protein
MVKKMVHEQLDLTDEESDGYKYFIEPPVPVKIKFTFMEVSNHEAVNDGSAEKPFLKEKGPYTYREDMIKKDLNWTSDGGEDEKQFLQFGQYKTYTFLPEESCDGCTEDDQVRILNMPLAGLIATLHNLGGTTELVGLMHVNKWLEAETDELFHLITVGDFLFRGTKAGAVVEMMEDTFFNDRLPPVFREENGFALFNGKQNTSENECYQVETSWESWEQHTVITKWGKDKESLGPDLSHAVTASWTGAHPQKWWPYSDAYGNAGSNVNGNEGSNNTCNQLRGTDGHQFPPFVNKDDQPELWLFNTVPCRSIFMKYHDKVKVKGITTLEYTVPEDGANVNKKINVCACEELSDLVASDDECLGSIDDDTLDISNCTINKCYDGLQDVTNCQGAPTFISYPHFHLAPKQQENFDGLAPDSEAHRTFLRVEPNTGMTLSLHSRIQLNTPVYNSLDLKTEVPALENIKTLPAFPILWIDEGADIDSDPDMVKKLKKQLVTPLAALNIGQWVAIGLGAALLVVGGAMTFKTCAK